MWTNALFAIIRDKSEILIRFDCGDDHNEPNKENKFKSYRSYIAQLYQKTLGRHKRIPLLNCFIWIVRDMQYEDYASMYIGLKKYLGSNKRRTI